MITKTETRQERRQLNINKKKSLRSVLNHKRKFNY